MPYYWTPISELPEREREAARLSTDRFLREGGRADGLALSSRAQPLATLQADVDRLVGAVARLKPSAVALSQSMPVDPRASVQAKVDAAGRELQRRVPSLSSAAANVRVLSEHPEWYAELEATGDGVADDAGTTHALTVQSETLDQVVRRLQRGDPTLSLRQAQMRALEECPELYEG